MSAPEAALKSPTGRIRASLVPGWYRRAFQLTGTLMPSLAVWWARKLFFTPQLRPKRRPHEAAVLERGERFELRSQAEEVVGWAWGKGPTVLLVHGWAGHAGQMTAWVEPLVQAGFRVVALDMPAHGDSGGQRASVVHFASALEAASRGSDPLHGVVAHSFGAAAVTYALSVGFKVDRVVFIAPTARFDAYWLAFRRHLGVSDAVWQQFIADSENWLRVRFEDLMPLRLAKQMRTPLKVFHDKEDREIAHGLGEELCGAWPGAQLVTTSGLGHLRILSDRATIEAATGFLSQ